ncbi:MAG: NIPSNAP family protein [Candidatus Poribacteria bacterium]|nr:NIPSNAP family protein [Candidatus Poribacteria bacterium]
MVYEQRNYIIPPGRMGDILSRFRDHTMGIFPRHGIEVVGFWVTDLGERSHGELMYLCRFEDLNARQAAWDSFRQDPEWIAVRKTTEANGPIVQQVDVKILAATDFSPLS